MSSKMAMLAQVASMDPEYDLSAPSPGALARSVDAASAVVASGGGVTPEDGPTRDGGRGGARRLPQQPPAFSPARKRSTSYDGRESRVTFCRDVVQTTFYPTERAIREEPLGEGVDLSSAQIADVSSSRPRSASCGNMSASSGSSVCSREEPLDVGASSQQEEMFQMD